MENLKPSDVAEAWVASYLGERGYQFDKEPDLGVVKRPDYLITAAGRTVVAEVKAFETFGLLAGIEPGGPTRSHSLKQALKPVRGQITEAAKQLRPLRDRGWPLVVILANPAERPIPLTTPMIISAMYGDLEVQIPTLPDGSAGEFRSGLGRNGKLTNDHEYVSAVAVVRREFHAKKWLDDWYTANRAEFGDDMRALAAAAAEARTTAPTGYDIFMEVFETVSEAAVPLPRDVFNGPLDHRWGGNPDGTGICRITPEPS
ncbi:hypothetical protein [Streptomyces sp. NPDC052811]|uniref:hypothetical protein n=1 Tax=Streptomyces sp. NPDC052811 TaxID=3155731 RepID=UPI003447040C